ncbi:MAG: SUMF1/EgtB/PvdO family nonheme iron enzyme [SAR324 cluster bacterium]|nr:SUMF1/EgtB/PvdO family nonheme iron enzyme [SAR324 cluster bacterium]
MPIQKNLKDKKIASEGKKDNGDFSGRELSSQTVLNGRYRIEKLSSIHEMTINYMAVDLSNQNKCFIQELSPINTARSGNLVIFSPNFTDENITNLKNQFLQRSKKLKGLSHPNLPKVKAFFEENNTWYMVTEYILGDVLSRQADNPLLLSDVMVWLRPLASALEYIHKKKTWHGDVKLSHMILTAENHLVLVGYEFLGNLTTNNLNNKGFHAPEQENGLISHLSDIYSMGAVVYRLLMGTAPESALSRQQAKSLNQPDPIQQNLNIKLKIAQSLEKAIHLHPDQRYHSVSLFIKDIAGKSQNTSNLNYKLWTLILGIILSGVVLGVFFLLQKPTYPPEWIDPYTQMKFIYIPESKFNMGNPEGESNENQIRSVKLDGFYIGQYEVSQHEWKVIMGKESAPFFFHGDTLPVENITRNQVDQFVDKFNLQHKNEYQFRLPTEAEWEYACSEGGKTGVYGDGQNQAQQNKMNYMNQITVPVGSFEHNSLRLYDMSGNVSELVADMYSENYKTLGNDNPLFKDGSLNVKRGGSFRDNDSWLKCTSRAVIAKDDKDSSVGFRLVRIP